MKGSQKDHRGHWGAFVGDLREPLNKKEGSGVGLQVVLVTKSAPGHFVPPYSQYCCDFCPGIRNGVEERKKNKWSHSVMSDSLRPHGLKPTRLRCPWDFPGKGTRVRCHFLLQGIFPTQGSNPGLLHCRQTLYPLSRQGSHGVEEGSPKAKHEGFGSGAACHVRSLGWF